MANPNLASILDTPMHEIERPKPMPQGTYTCNVLSYREDKSSKKQTQFIEYTLQPLAAADDVDEDELESMGGLANRTLRVTYYITPDALWRLRKFLEDCGVDTGTKKNPVPLSEAIPQAIGCQVAAFVKHEPSKAPGSTDVFANVAYTAAA